MVSNLPVRSASLKGSKRYPDVSGQNRHVTSKLGLSINPMRKLDSLDSEVAVLHWKRSLCFMQRECDLQHNFCFTDLLDSFDRVSGVGKRHVQNSLLKSRADCEDCRNIL